MSFCNKVELLPYHSRMASNKKIEFIVLISDQCRFLTCRSCMTCFARKQNVCQETGRGLAAFIYFCGNMKCHNVLFFYSAHMSIQRMLAALDNSIDVHMFILGWVVRSASIPKITGSNPSGGSELTICSDLLLTARGGSTWALIEFARLLWYPSNALCS
jgi:hypothetical protein